MAGDSVIGALRIVLGADTGSLEDGLKKSSEGLKNFARDAAAVATGVGLEKFVEKVTESFVHLVKESINVADEMGKLSQKIGIPVESLSSLSVAAKLADVSIETFSKGIGIMNKQLVAAAAGGTNAAAAAFQYLGISVKGIKDLKPEVAFGMIADKISKLDDGATKTAVSMAIFGSRLGKELIPLLNAGAKGFEEMRVMAENLGLVISTDTAKKAEKFNDNVKLMGLAVQGVGMQVAAFFLPAMAKASESLIKWVSDSKLVASASEFLIRVFVLISDNAKLLGGVLLIVFGATIVRTIAALGLAILSLASAMVAGAVASGVMAARFLIAFASISLVAGAVLLATGNLDKFLVSIENMAKDIPALSDVTSLMAAGLKAAGVDVGALTKTFEQLKGEAGVKGLEDEFKKLYNTKPFDPKSAEAGKKFGDEIAKIRFKAQELRGEFDTLAPGFIAAAQKLGLIKDNASNFDVALVALNPKMMTLNAELLKLAGAKVTQENLTGIQQFQQEMTKLNLLVNSGNISWDTWARAAMKAAETAGVSISKLSTDILGGWTELFQALGKENKKFFEMGQALAIVMAIINTAEGVTKALAQGGFLGYAMAAAVAAKGLAQIITIRQQKYTGAAEGGKFQVPGGSMGVDTRMITMALAPGELVEVTPAGQAQGSGGGSSNGYLELSPIRPKDFFTGDVVREMVFSIDQWMRNGGTGVGFAKR